MARTGAARADWRDGLTVAGDLALIGIAVTVASVPVLTAGAAVRTGSVAVRHVVDGERVASAADLWRVFRRSLLPGAVASALVLMAAAVLAVDVAILTGDRIPGGRAVLVVTALVAAGLLALAALTAVRLGAEPSQTWRACARWALTTARRSPAAAAATVGVVALAAVLAVLVPVTAPLLVGFTLYALHAVARRLA